MEKIRETISLGRQAFENKDFGSAEKYLKGVVQSGLKYADVFNMLGVIEHAAGKFESAIDMFKRALTINPRYTEAILNLAVIYNDLGNYDDAKDLYSMLKKRGSDAKAEIEPVLKGKLSNLHADIGDIYRSIGIYKPSIEEYEKALKLNPSYHDIRTRLGIALREAGQNNSALKQFQNILDLENDYIPALIQKGITLYSMNRRDEARQTWMKALKFFPENKDALMYLKLSEPEKTDSTKKSVGGKPGGKIKKAGKKTNARKKA